MPALPVVCKSKYCTDIPGPAFITSGYCGNHQNKLVNPTRPTASLLKRYPVTPREVISRLEARLYAAQAATTNKHFDDNTLIAYDVMIKTTYALQEAGELVRYIEEERPDTEELVSAVFRRLAEFVDITDQELQGNMEGIKEVLISYEPPKLYQQRGNEQQWKQKYDNAIVKAIRKEDTDADTKMILADLRLKLDQQMNDTLGTPYWKFDRLLNILGKTEVIRTGLANDLVD